ncbi:MAG: metallophosphoesterase [Oceanospirillaceae bacterium]
MVPLQVVQITDIHLLADENSLHYEVDTALSLTKVLNKIKSLTVDLIVVSGDLTEDGKASTYKRLAKIFKSLTVPVFFLPGNHDDPILMTEHLNDSNLNHCFSMEMAGWGFLFLHSQVEGCSFGKIGNQQLTKIDKYLTDHCAKPVFIAQHHPSFTVCPVAGCQLEDAAILQKILMKHNNVKVIVAGHTHNDKEDLSLNYAQYVTPSSFAFATHDQDCAKHRKDDFWAAHKLDPSKIGFRYIQLTKQGAVESEVIWV